MKRYIIPTVAILMVAASTTFGAITYFNYFIGTDLSDGEFAPSGYGNTGKIDYTKAYLDGSNLRGYFEIQTVGSGTFNIDARIVPPAADKNPTRTCWDVLGTADSRNAGTIWLDSGSLTTLAFNPVSRKLEGYGYNGGIGRVPFGDGTSCDGDNLVTDAEVVAIQNGTDTTNTIDTTIAGFIGRVKIIGNAGGTTVFDTFYSQGVKFNASLFNTTLQRIRKNVGLLTRNLGATQKNGSTLVGDKMFLIDQPMKLLSTISNPNDIRSIIIVGGDLYIDQDFTGSILNNPKGIIVLKDENGVGGNIYIGDDVKNISASIFTEGTIYSGESSSNLYNDRPEEIADLPSNQLYILGALISRNTIGGASKSATEVLCPYNETCTFADATKYDLNYFRGFQTSGATDPNRAYKDETLDDYSLIIETDRRATANPPPGFE